jgi:hypothetical protein
MEDIYRLAHRVVVWLGERSEGTELAFQEIKGLGQQVIVDGT